MRVKKKLHIHVGLSAITALVIVMMLFLALHRVTAAMEAAEIAGDIISGIFEKSTFRHDYLQTNSERAKKQWFVKQQQMGRLLAFASKKDWRPQEKLLVREMVDDYESVGKLFTAIVAGREKAAQQPASAAREVEDRLLTQLAMRTYDTVRHARELQEVSRERLFSAIRLAGWSIILMLAVMIAAVLVSTWNVTRMVASRVERLRQGAAAIGEGNLGYRVGLTGDDEFVELSEAFDGMTGKLRQSYLDLEREVSERRRAEESLRESEARFRGTFENAAVGITLLDPAGRLMRANGKLCEILGYPEEELRGRSFSSFTHPDDVEPDLSRYALLMRGELESYEVEKRYIRKDGSHVWVRVTRSARLDELGLPADSISIVQDVGARKEAEEKLRESENRYRTLFNAIDEGFCIIEMIFDDAGKPIDYRFLENNPAFERQTGLANVQGKTIREFAPEHEEHWFETYGEIALSGQPARFDNLAEQLGRWYDVYAFRFGQPESRQVAVLFSDITESKQAEQELRESEENFRAVFEQAAVGMARVSLTDARWIDVNDAFCRMLGYSADEMRAIPWPHMTKPEDIDLDLSSFHRMAAGELESYSVEKRFIHKHGHQVWARLTLSLVHDPQRRPVYEIAIVENITERKRAEEAVQESEERLRAIFDTAGVGIVEVSGDDRVIAANDRMCEILGYRREELLAMNVHELTAPEDRPLSDEMNRQVHDGRLPRAAYDKRYLKGDGSPLWVHVNVSGVRDAQGGWLRSIATVEDISARKAAEDALRAREAELREAQRIAGLGSWLWDPESDTVYWSDETFQIFGLDPDKDTPRFYGGHRELFPAESLDRLKGAADLALTTGAPYELDLEMMYVDGTRRWVTARGEADRDDAGGVKALHGTIQDITGRKRAEEELRKAKDELEARVRERTAELSRTLENLRTETEERIQAVEELRKKEQLLIQQSRLAAMGEMLVNISHQWRQPLNVLGLILQEQYRNYQRGNFTGEYLEGSVAKGRELISHMSRTIDDFRNFFIPEKIKVSFEVKEVVESTLSIVGDSFKEMQLDLRLVAEEPVFIEGYRNEFAQALMNILINARDVFRERRVVNPQITVKIARENGRCVVTVTDNAGGIAGDVIDKIFDPYFSTKPPDKGTGIGLFMSKTIIEKNMNGSLRVRNTGEGAEFRIEV